MRWLRRSIARRHYEEFSRRWRWELRAAKLYGKKGSPKRPRFNEWWHMHQGSIAATAQSSPQDVREHLALETGVDPWDDSPWVREPGNPGSPEPIEVTRGVETIDVAGDPDTEA